MSKRTFISVRIENAHPFASIYFPLGKFNKIVSWLLILSFVFVCHSSSEAADTASATKTKNPDGTYATTTTGFFPIGAGGQTVAWEANYFGTGLEGNDFYLHTDPANLTSVPLSTGLGSGLNTGTAFLTAGNYAISINYFGMGPGNYTITYNRTATISVAPISHPFGGVLAGSSSTPFTFTISKSGDLDVTISSIVSSDPGHFEVITPNPVGQVVGPNRTFQVRFKALTTPGPYSANITISGSSSLGATAPVTVTVSGNTLPTVPNIVCSGSSCGSGSLLGSADGNASPPETKTLPFSFNNNGTEQLVISSVTLVNDSAAAPFSLAAPPSTAPVPASGSRSVQIAFAPPPGEAMYCGHLVILSNDPDEPTKLCFFQARGHHPVPIMRVVSDVLDYHEVELGFSFTKAIFVYNDGDAPLTVSVTDLALTDPDHSQWSSLELGGPFSVSPGTTPRIFKQVFTPLVPGPHDIHLQVSGNDLANPVRTITLTGVGVAAVPIDGLLVLDRSGSMSESAGPQTKIQALQKAASLFVDLLRPQLGGPPNLDKIGIVRYNQNHDAYLPLDFKTPTDVPGTQLGLAIDKLSVAAISDVSRLAPDGTTGIGGAMQQAAGMLLGSAADRKHVMVVLTDGIENEAPYIPDVVGPIRAADPALQMYSIGLGSHVQLDRLQMIPNVGNGFHQVADDLSGVSWFDLETFYFKIFSHAGSMDLVVDPTHPVLLSGINPTIIETARIVSSDRSATFLVLDEPSLRVYYDLELVDPHGQVINIGTSVGGIPVHKQQRYDYSIYRVVFPDISLASSYVGDWILRLTPNGKYTNRVDHVKGYNTNQQNIINPYQGVVPVGFAAAVKSDYRMDVNVLPSNLLPGADVKLTAALSDRDWPSSSGQVFVNVTTPLGTKYDGLQLYNDGSHGDASAADGTWTTHFGYTGESGSYRFFFHAVGVNERGELTPREATRYLTLMVASPTPPGKGGGQSELCIPCRIQWIALLVILLLLLLLVRCMCIRSRPNAPFGN